MAISNRERVGKGLDLLAAGVRPFVERELQEHLGKDWEKSVRENSRSSKDSLNWNDPHVILGVMWDHWNSVFRSSLGQSERSLVSELRGFRNQWAHHEKFSSNDAIRALDSMERLLTAVSAAEQVREVEQMRMDLMRLVFDEQRRQEMRKKSFPADRRQPAGRAQAVARSRHAASRRRVGPVSAGGVRGRSVAGVTRSEGTDEYRTRQSSFRRTFITEGLRRLL
jgi:hypothetical protein